MNPTPVPQTKYNQIVECLNVILKSGSINELELKRYKNEAEKLKNHNPSEAFTLLGIIACLEKKIEEMHSYHKKALTYSNNPIYLLQYTTSLINVELFDDAYPYALEAFKNDQNNLQIIDALITITYEIDNYEELITYTSLWKKIKGEPHPYATFLEDNDDKLSQMIINFDELIKNKPELVVKPDPKLIKLVDELVDGVDIA